MYYKRKARHDTRLERCWTERSDKTPGPFSGDATRRQSALRFPGSLLHHQLRHRRPWTLRVQTEQAVEPSTLFQQASILPLIH